MLIAKTVGDLLRDFSAPSPTPGGGSAAALAGAVGAALLAMVAGMNKTRRGEVEDRAALEQALPSLLGLRDRLAALVDEDTLAYDAVVAAYRLPKATDAEKAARKAAIHGAMLAATTTPLETVRACAEALGHAPTVAAHGNPAAASDIRVGMGLLLAGLRGARENVDINLDSLADPESAANFKRECAELLVRAEGHASRAETALRG
jgi:formiminotetrahydrofolate cyclodeaminase